MQCDHNGYDDYFERCDDCGKTNAQIHDSECLYDPSGISPDEDDCCDKCGVTIDLKTYKSKEQ